MSGIDDSAPAFPVADMGQHGAYGMTLRDYFAAKAMTAMSLKLDAAYSQQDRQRGYPETEARWAAIAAYRYADAMLAIRAQEQTK